MKYLVLLSLQVLCQVLGDIWLSRGMKGYPQIESISFSTLARLSIFIVTNFWIWWGIVFLVLSLILYLAVISRLDLSYVLPMQTSSYVLNAFLAWSILGEEVNPYRWGSTILISIGVFFVGCSERKTQNLQDEVKFLWLPLNLSPTWLLVFVISLADSAGDLCLAMGMKKIGKLKLSLSSFSKITTNHFIYFGILFQTIAFFSFISVLTWADISFVRPATSLTFVFSLIGAKYILKEKIYMERFMGIAFVAIGLLIHR